MNTITVIYKSYENNSFSVKTLKNLGESIAFVLREEIDRYLFLENGNVIAGESWNGHDFKMRKVRNGIVLQVGYNDFDYVETISYLYTNTGNLYKSEGGEKWLETLDGIKQQYSFYSKEVINNFLKEKYKEVINNYYIMSHECIYTDSYLYECGHYVDEDEIYYDKIYYSKTSGNSSKCLSVLLEQDGISAGSEDYFNIAEAIRLFAERKTETKEVSQTHKRYGLCFGCINAKNTRIKTWYHGLQAFNRTEDKGINGSIERVVDIMSHKWDICVSSDAIGPIGLIYKGHVDRYYDHDTWSYLDDNGNRIPGMENENSDHDEGILSSAKKPVGLWVKSWYWETLNSADREELSLFSDELNLKIVTLPSRK